MKGFLEKESHTASQMTGKDLQRAKTSVIIFLIGVLSIVLFGSIDSLRPSFEVGGEKVQMGMTQLIEIIMMSIAGLMIIFARVDINKAVKGSVFIAGMQAVIAIFGIAWMGDTFFNGNIEFFQNAHRTNSYSISFPFCSSSFCNVCSFI
ncbi:Anaerobic C4-dicarboxylate transporter DcuA [Capnocytophaga ochracea]|uniref:Anaerobic C4-dicarboxylate transporter DcuA n=1 Tax=Capnocytophaga ochracea TaxID=1018 RepID=A0A2X1H3C9_CAPOC|nr:Anaerobic C4-dicarboxylate transporter DcuA [Capnocytophaga ochracea]